MGPFHRDGGWGRGTSVGSPPAPQQQVGPGLWGSDHLQLPGRGAELVGGRGRDVAATFRVAQRPLGHVGVSACRTWS